MSRVAKRYSKAVFQLAIEKKMIDRVESDFKQITGLLRESSEFVRLLENPLINTSVKFEAVKNVLIDHVSDVTLNLLRLMAEKKRLSILPEVVDEFEQRLLSYRDIIQGELVSAVELSEAQFGQINRKIEEATGKKVILQKQLDPGIIGGFIVKVEDIVFDNSIRFQLNKLRERLVAQ